MSEDVIAMLLLIVIGLALCRAVAGVVAAAVFVVRVEWDGLEAWTTKHRRARQ